MGILLDCGMEFYRFQDQRADGKAYFEFLRTEELSAGVYRLPVGAIDQQQPHGEQEIYYIVAGRGRFRAGERDIAVSTGDILFVAAKESHLFHNIEEDLQLLVFFAPAEGSSERNPRYPSVSNVRGLRPEDSGDSQRP